MRKFFLFIGVIFCLNCTPKTTGETIGTNENIIEEAKLHAEIAKDICNCSKGIINIYKGIKELTEEEKEVQATGIEKKINEESQKSEACVEQLMTGKFNGIIIDENLMESALRENCPNFYNMLKIGKM